MENIDAVYNAYMFMKLSENDTPDQIKRQYKDLMILWHPDKHHNNNEEYVKYENLTKKLTSAYDCIINYINLNGLPSFNISKCAVAGTFNIFDIPDESIDPFEKAEYYSSLGASDLLDTMAYNALVAPLNVATKVFNIFCELTVDKWRRESIKAIVASIRGIKVYRHTVRINSVSYSRKINFAEFEPEIEESLIDIFKNIFKKNKKVDYTKNPGMYLRFLDDNMFCGIKGWRMISSNDLLTLLLLARAQGYDIGNGRVYRNASDQFDKEYEDNCDINTKRSHARNLEHVPLNGKKFKDFLLSLGFYNITNDLIYYKHNSIIYEYNIDNHVSQKPQSPITSLWPVCDGIEELADKHLIRNNANT